MGREMKNFVPYFHLFFFNELICRVTGLNVLNSLSKWGESRTFFFEKEWPLQPQFFAWGRCFRQPGRLNSPRKWNLHRETKGIRPNSQTPSGIIPGCAQGRCFSQIPAAMGCTSVEILDNEEGTCKDYPAGRSCGRRAMGLRWEHLPAQGFCQLKDTSLWVVNSRLWDSAHWTVVCSRRLLTHFQQNLVS